MDVKLRAFPRPAGGEGGKKKVKPKTKKISGRIFFLRRCVIYTSSSVPPSSPLTLEVYGREPQKYDRPHNSVFTSPGRAKTHFSGGRLCCVGKQGKSTLGFLFPLCWLESVYALQIKPYVMSRRAAPPTQTPFPGNYQKAKPGVWLCPWRPTSL